MPEISRFFGIVVKMYYEDHNPPIFTLSMAMKKLNSRSPIFKSLTGDSIREQRQ